MAKPVRPKHYDRPGKRPGPEGKGSYVDQKAAEDARQQLGDRDKMFERVRAAQTFIGTVRNQEHAEELELQAFMSIFHPEKRIEPGTRRIVDREKP